MSYDLYFWRYKAGVKLQHRQVCSQLSDLRPVNGLEDLPIDRVLSRVREVFSDWSRLDDVTFESANRGVFQLFSTAQFFGVHCSGVPAEEINKLIDIGIEFKCAFYDPQIDERFDQG